MNLTNPFRDGVATDPWRPVLTDVPDIHRQAYQRCLQALDDVRAHGRTASALIYGEAGSGKTHLLWRLRNALSEPGAVASGFFISVLLQTSPQMIWRHLRRRMVDDLLRCQPDQISQLEKILQRRLAESQHPGTETGADTAAIFRQMKLEARHHNRPVRELELLFDEVELYAPAALDNNFRNAISHLALDRHLRDARAWLRSESLPEAALARLDLCGASDDDNPEDSAREIVLSLCALAGPQAPLVICFDQVEGMQIHPQDQTGLFAFGQMLMTLFNQTRNLLLVSCIQSSYHDTMRESLSGAAWQRLIRDGQELLRPLERAEAEQLVLARLNSDPQLAAERSQHADPFWPLSAGTIDAALDQAGCCTPRHLLGICAERLDPGPGSLPLDDILHAEFQRRQEQALRESSPEQSDQILDHGLPLLLQLQGKKVQQRTHLQSPDVDLVIGTAPEETSLSFCNHENMTSLAGRLRRLSARPPQRLALLRDARLPIGPHARKSREYVETLIGKGARLTRPSAEMMAALDALRILLSEARSGDLSYRGETISAQSVESWLALNLPGCLQDLATELLPEKENEQPADFALCEDIGELLHHHYLVSIEHAAIRLEQPQAAIESCARRHPDRFGLLDGPPAVLFQLTADTPGAGL